MESHCIRSYQITHFVIVGIDSWKYVMTSSLVLIRDFYRFLNLIHLLLNALLRNFYFDFTIFIEQRMEMMSLLYIGRECVNFWTATVTSNLKTILQMRHTDRIHDENKKKFYGVSEKLMFVSINLWHRFILFIF